MAGPRSRAELGRGRAALVGFVFGWVADVGGYHWMWRIVDVFLAGNVFLGGFLWLCDSSWFALRFALYGVLYVSTPAGAAGPSSLRRCRRCC